MHCNLLPTSKTDRQFLLLMNVCLNYWKKKFIDWNASFCNLIRNRITWKGFVLAFFLGGDRLSIITECQNCFWTITFHQFVSKITALTWEALCSHSETRSLKAALALKRYATTLALTNRLCPAVIRRFVVVWLRSTQRGPPSEGSHWDNRTSLELHRPLRVRRSVSALLRLGNVARHAARGATWCSHRSTAEEKSIMLFTWPPTIWPSVKTKLHELTPV